VLPSIGSGTPDILAHNGAAVTLSSLRMDPPSYLNAIPETFLFWKKNSFKIIKSRFEAPLKKDLIDE
jgi:hypothetical protein